MWMRRTRRSPSRLAQAAAMALSAPSDSVTLTVTDDDTPRRDGCGRVLEHVRGGQCRDRRAGARIRTATRWCSTSEPTDDVRVDITAPGMVTLEPESQPYLYSVELEQVVQTVTATAVNDAIDNPGDERVGRIAHAVVAGGSDYAGVECGKCREVTVTDDDGDAGWSPWSIDSPSVAEGDESVRRR